MVGSCGRKNQNFRGEVGRERLVLADEKNQNFGGEVGREWLVLADEKIKTSG